MSDTTMAGLESRATVTEEMDRPLLEEEERGVELAMSPLGGRMRGGSVSAARRRRGMNVVRALAGGDDEDEADADSDADSVADSVGAAEGKEQFVRRMIQKMREMKKRSFVQAAMDLTVMLKGLLSSVAILLLLEPSRLLSCEGEGIPAGQVKVLCRPNSGVGVVRVPLAALVAVNQLLFVAAICLKYGARRLVGTVLARASQTVAFMVSSVAMVLAVCKVMLVVYSFLLEVHFGAALRPDDTSPHVTFAEGLVTDIAFEADTLDSGIFCSNQCTAKVPLEVGVLAANFILSAMYVAYLGFQFSEETTRAEDERRRANASFFDAQAGVDPAALLAEEARQLAAERAGGGRRPAAAKLSEREMTERRALNVLVQLEMMRDLKDRRRSEASRAFYFQLLRDLAALAKFVATIVSMAIVLFGTKNLVQCSEVVDPSTGEVVTTGSVLRDNCNVSVGASFQLYAFVTLSGITAIIYAGVVALDKTLALRSYATVVVRTTIVFVALVVVSMMAFVGWLPTLDPNFLCSGVEPTPISGETNTFSWRCRDSAFTRDSSCVSNCVVSTPLVVYVLAANIFLSLVYLINLALNYRESALQFKEAEERQRRALRFKFATDL